jgi:hypothetical protein
MIDTLPPFLHWHLPVEERYILNTAAPAATAKRGERGKTGALLYEKRVASGKKSAKNTKNQ